MTAASTGADELRRRVQQAAGWDLSGSRGDLFASALARMALAAGQPAEAQARAILAGGERALTAFLAEAAVGETWFFRDPDQWTFVDETVIPGALTRRSPHDAQAFRAWAAGCASGEEPYTLAMLLADRGLLARARLLASDLSESALARARAGEYTHWSLRGGLDPRARRWLHEVGGRLRVDARIAAAVEFFQLNLAEPSYPDARRDLAALDLVLCRNVLLYLRTEVVADVAARLFEALAPGGWLLTSPSDPALRRHAPFEVRAGPFGVAYQRPERAPRPRPLPPGADASPRTRAPSRPAPPPPAPSATAARPRVRLAAHDAPVDACPGCRALIDSGRLGEALELVDAAARRVPLAPELHLLRAIVMADLGELREAEAACRRAVYLARDEPFLRFFMGTILVRLRDAPGASAAFRAAIRLVERRDPNEEIPWSEGMTAGELAAAARWQLGRLEGGVPARP